MGYAGPCPCLWNWSGLIGLALPPNSDIGVNGKDWAIKFDPTSAMCSAEEVLLLSRSLWMPMKTTSAPESCKISTVFDNKVRINDIIL